MAIYTDFFIASEIELQAAFPQRFPVAKRPKVRKVKNPFTGKTQAIKQWGPAKPFPKGAQGVAYPTKAESKAVQKLAGAAMKGVDPRKLAALQVIMDGGDLVAHLDELSRPALLAPGDDSSGLFRLPPPFLKALVELAKVEPIAKQWAATEECQMDEWKAKDAATVIKSLQTLSRQALEAGKNVYLWMNL